jgi:adenylate kinase
MRFALMGPPGAGKGTQADILARRFGVPKISTGDMLREAARDGTELGRAAKEYTDRGLLVPDEMILQLVKRRLEEPDAAAGFLLDGFPRTVAQAEALQGLLNAVGKQLWTVIDLQVDTEELIRRLTGRRTCPVCERSYHLVNRPPQVPGKCDESHGPLIQRDDDSEPVIRARLAEYHRRTQQVLDYYRQRGLLRPVAGEQPAEKVTADIVGEIERAKPQH